MTLKTHRVPTYLQLPSSFPWFFSEVSAVAHLDLKSVLAEIFLMLN